MTTKDIVYIALFAALTAALGLFPPLSVPVITVPVTAQSMGVMLAGSIIGARRGALALLLFLLLVAIGMPLLAGGKGGFGVFLGPSGGFLVGWPVGAFVVGWLFERYWNRLNFVNALLFLVLGGILVIYVFGIPWMSAVLGLSILEAATGSIAYIPGDLVKVVVTALVALTVKRSYPLITARA